MNTHDIRIEILPRIIAWVNSLPNANHWHEFDRPVRSPDYHIKIVTKPNTDWGLSFIASGECAERLRVMVDPPHGPPGALPVVTVIDDDAKTYRIP